MFLYPIDAVSVMIGHSPAHSFDNSVLKEKRNIDYVSPAEFTVHSHPYFSINYVIDCDEFTTKINNCKVNFKKNHIYMQPKNTLHTPTNLYTGAISSVSIRFYVTDKELEKELSKHPVCLPADDDMLELISEISEYAKGGTSKKGSLNSLVAELISRINKNPVAVPIVPDDNVPSGGQIFFPLIEYMYAHYTEDLSLSDLARVVYMEPTYFAKKFKQFFNITPVNYLYSVRLFRSLDELMFSGISIAAIAEKVGFKNVAAYCTAFRRAYGLSPSEYRQSVSEQKFHDRLS